MTTTPDPYDLEVLLRGALTDDLEVVMTLTDTERELDRFQTSLRRDGRRRSLVAAAAALAVGAVGVGTWALLQTGGPTPRPAITAARPLEAGEATSTALPGAPSPRSLDVVAGRVVVSAPSGLTVLDADGAVVRQLTVPDTELYGPLVEADGAVWSPFLREDDEGYLRLDLDTGEVLARAEVGIDAFLSAGPAGLWAVAPGTQVVELDPQTGAVRRTVDLPVRPFGLAVAEDAVWAQEARGGRLLRIDAATGEVTEGPELPGSFPLVVADGSLWVVDGDGAALRRFDASTGAEQGRTSLPGTSTRPETEAGLWIGAGEGSVYVTSTAGATRLLTRVDAQSGEVLDVVELGPGGLQTLVTAGLGSVWTAYTASPSVERMAAPERG